MRPKWVNTGIKVCVEGNLGKIELKYVVIYAIFWGKKLPTKCDRVKFVTNSMSASISSRNFFLLSLNLDGEKTFSATPP